MEKNISRKINLIPQELAVPPRAIKLADLLNKISVVLAIVLVILTLSTGGLIYYFTNQNETANKKISALKIKISTLEKSEQKLVLAKDRLSKINVAQKAKSVDDEITRFKKFTDLLLSSSDTSLIEANLNSKGTEITVLSKNTDALRSILKPLSDFVDYKRIILSSLAFNPDSGYLSTISLENE